MRQWWLAPTGRDTTEFTAADNTASLCSEQLRDHGPVRRPWRGHLRQWWLAATGCFAAEHAGASGDTATINTAADTVAIDRVHHARPVYGDRRGNVREWWLAAAGRCPAECTSATANAAPDAPDGVCYDGPFRSPGRRALRQRWLAPAKFPLNGLENL